jgi:thioredoxin reductase
MDEPTIDAAVIGGGAAGLSGALTLARSRRSVLVIDTGHPRNAPAAHMHNYLSRDGMPPNDFLAAGREEVLSYGGRIATSGVKSVSRIRAGQFRIALTDGTTVNARRVLVATGLTDVLPDVPGLADRWGRDVLHCPYCHGWEVRDKSVGILATSPLAVHSAQLFRQLTQNVTLFQHTAPDLPHEEHERLAARDIRVVTGKVISLNITDDELTGVTLADGTTVPLQALAVTPRLATNVPPTLDLTTAEFRVGDTVIGEYVTTDPTGATNIPGVWAAGNVTNPQDQISNATASGARAAAAINMDLIEEEIHTAITNAKPFSASMERAVTEQVLGNRRHGL